MISFRIKPSCRDESHARERQSEAKREDRQRGEGYTKGLKRAERDGIGRGMRKIHEEGRREVARRGRATKEEDEGGK